MYKLHKHASHEMYLIKTCIYPTTIDAEWYEQDYIRLKEDRKNFKRIYIPDFEFERKENIINLKIECLFGHQLNRERCDKRIREIIYEEFVLVDGDYGIKDYSFTNFIMKDDMANIPTWDIGYVDLEAYKKCTLQQRQYFYFKDICEIKLDELPFKEK